MILNRSTAEQSYGPAPASALFQEALHENSNLEVDWLWFFTQLTDERERRYCLQRALAINPQNRRAREELAKLFPHHPRPKEPERNSTTMIVRLTTPLRRTWRWFHNVLRSA